MKEYKENSIESPCKDCKRDEIQFSNETIKDIENLSMVLQRVYARLRKEGQYLKNGKFFDENDNEVPDE